VACGQTLHPHPGPPPSQGEGSLCANPAGEKMWVAISLVGKSGEGRQILPLRAGRRQLSSLTAWVYDDTRRCTGQLPGPMANEMGEGHSWMTRHRDEKAPLIGATHRVPLR
jgi:hypothetical protein